MNIKIQQSNVKLARKFQQGGPMEAVPAEDQTMSNEAPMEGEPAPEQGGGEDPLMQLAQLFAQGLQNQDCNLLALGAQMFLQLIQQMGGGAPTQEEPVFARRGGKLVRKN